MANKQSLDIGKLVNQDRQDRSSRRTIPESFVAEHLSMIESVSSTVCSGSKLPPGVAFNDLVSWGVEGLIKAKSRFDDTKGTQFKTYAHYRVRGEILDSLRKEWSYRCPGDYVARQKNVEARVADITKSSLSDPASKMTTNTLISNAAMVYMVSLDDIDPNNNPVHPEDMAADLHEKMDAELYCSVLVDEVKSLSDNEKRFIKLFYFENKKQKDISVEFGISASQVSKLHVKLLEKLRNRLERHLSSVALDKRKN